MEPLERLARAVIAQAALDSRKVRDKENANGAIAFFLRAAAGGGQLPPTEVGGLQLT